MKKLLLFTFCILHLTFNIFAQRQMENLGRGLVAAKVTNGVFVNWRITGQEWRRTTYNLYRDNMLLNTAPLTVSNFTDNSGTLASTYQVAAVIGGVEQAKSAAVGVQANNHLEIPMRALPVGGYELNDATCADLDGDGEMEIIVKRLYPDWSPSAQHFTYFEAYKLDGTFLWAINVGPNIFSDVETNIAAFDFDGDGKAEVFMRTSEGTVFANGDTVKGANGTVTNYRSASWGGENGDYPNHSTYLCAGPEFLSLINGETGVEITRTDYIPRGTTADWGDSYGHRANKFFFGAPYLDGKKPSLFISRGIYTRIVMKTFDVTGSGMAMQLVPRWTFDTNTAGNAAYAYQGNHNYNIADVDGDGRDEIVYGSMVIDDNGQGLYSTGLGHGDAIHTGDFDPYRKGLEVFACLESSPNYGTTLRAAENGQILLQYIKGSDCGRAIAANWSNAYAGAELAPGAGAGVWSASERRTVSTTAASQNFRIYWDGDLLEELVDHNMNNTLGKGEGRIDKWNGSAWQTLLTTSGYYSCNYTKGTPCLQADLFGDWREELIYRSADDTKLRIYFTTAPTAHRIYTLLHDHQYRQAICWQMCGYNQPPHTSFFLGEKEGITVPPPPAISNGKMVYGSPEFDWNNVNGKDLLFDVSGAVDTIILPAGSSSPKSLTVNSPENFVFDNKNMINTGFTGNMTFVKQGKGTFCINRGLIYNGVTEVWDGKLVLNGTALYDSKIWLNLHSELETDNYSFIGNGLEMNYGSKLYINSCANIHNNLILKNNSIIQFDLNNNKMLCDSIKMFEADDTVKISGNPVFQIIADGDTLAAGDYTLIETANISGNISDIKIEGLATQIISLIYENGKLILRVENMRAGAGVVWKGDKTGAIWNKAKDRNFTLNNAEAYFAVGDSVLFDNSGINKTVNITDSIAAAYVEVNSTANYTFSGSGAFTGNMNLVKRGSGSLTINNRNNYNGKTIVEGGAFVMLYAPTVSENGSIGANQANADYFTVRDSAIIRFNTANEITSRGITFDGAKGGVIDCSVALYHNGILKGTKLTKTGSQTLFIGNNNQNLAETVLRAGTIKLNADAAVPYGVGRKITLLNGTTLETLNSTGAYLTSSHTIEVPAGSAARVIAGARCEYNGALTGSGTLTWVTDFIRAYINGNWSAFEGKINLTKNSANSSYEDKFIVNTSAGFPKAAIDIASGVKMCYKNGTSDNGTTTIKIGMLTGAGEFYNAGLEVGETNASGTFSGLISGATSLRKVGTGAWTLSGTQSYTGTTTVAAGTLNISGSIASGSIAIQNNGTLNLTGTAGGTANIQNGGTLNLTGTLGGSLQNSGLLKGTGKINGSVMLNSNSETQPAGINIGTLTFGGNVTMATNAKLSMQLTATTNDKIDAAGNVTCNGTLDVTLNSGTLSAGKEFQLIKAAAILGAFSEINLPALSTELQWDTTALYTEGKISIVEASAVHFPELAAEIAPNPSDGIFVINLTETPSSLLAVVYNLNGEKIYEENFANASKLEIDLTEQNSGIYLLQLFTKDKTSKHIKLIKK